MKGGIAGRGEKEKSERRFKKSSQPIAAQQNVAYPPKNIRKAPNTSRTNLTGTYTANTVQQQQVNPRNPPKSSKRLRFLLFFMVFSFLSVDNFATIFALHPPYNMKADQLRKLNKERKKATLYL